MIALDRFADAVGRLADDLARFPYSPTLSGVALRDEHGNVVGMSMGCDLLALAYSQGAPAELVVDAERLRSLTDPVQDGRLHPGRVAVAVRLAHAVRSVNRRLRQWVAGDALGIVTVVGHWATTSPVSVQRAGTDLYLATSTPGTRGHPVDTDADPPPLDSPTLGSVLRSGPPHLALVRPGKVMRSGTAVSPHRKGRLALAS